METKIEVGQDWTDGIVVVRVLEVQSDGEVGYGIKDAPPRFNKHDGTPLGPPHFCQGAVFRATRTLVGP